MKVHIQLTTWFKKYSIGKNEITVDLETTAVSTAGVEVDVDVDVETDAYSVKGADVSTDTGIGVDIDAGVKARAGESAKAKIGYTAREAIIAAGIPVNEVGVITKDGIKIAEDLCLKDGDKIKIFTTILGG